MSERLILRLTPMEVVKLADLLKADGHDYEYAQAGCVICKLHEHLVRFLRAKAAEQRKVAR